MIEDHKSVFRRVVPSLFNCCIGITNLTVIYSCFLGITHVTQGAEPCQSMLFHRETIALKVCSEKPVMNINV